MRQLRQQISLDWPVWLAALLSFAAYILLALWFPLRSNFNLSPSPDIRSLAPSLGNAFAYAGVLGLLYCLYWIAYRRISRRERGVNLAVILGLAGLYCLPLIFTFPINATDVYRYFIRGRISSVYHESPYELSASDFSQDPYLPLAGEWAAETSPYGPVWELTAGAATSLFPDNLWAALLTFKGLAALTHLIAGALIWLALPAEKPAQRAALTLLWAWNPSLLLVFAGDGHNDGLMLLWLLLGWLLIQRGRPQMGILVMLLAPLTKPIGLLPLPFFFLGGWRQLSGWSASARYLILTGLIGLALLWFTFLPFGSPVELAIRLIQEVETGGGFSPLAWFILEARNYGYDPSIQTTTRIATALFICLALWLGWQTVRGRSPVRAATDIFNGYVFQAFRFRVWYAVWAFPWLLLDRGQASQEEYLPTARLSGGLAFLLTSQLSVLIYGQIRTELLGTSQLRAHRAGVLFTFGLPLLVALLAAVYNARLRDPHIKR